MNCPKCGSGGYWYCTIARTNTGYDKYCCGSHTFPGSDTTFYQSLQCKVIEREAELTHLKELVFGDKVKEKMLGDVFPPLTYTRRSIIEDFQQALKEAMGKHIHVRSDAGDACKLCGLDLRNEIHQRVIRKETVEEK